MDSYAVHLAMAALVGASFVAVSAYYMHRRTLSQLLEFARKVGHESGSDSEQEAHSQGYRKVEKRRRGRKSAPSYRRSSASLPDVSSMADGGYHLEAGMEKKLNGPSSVEDGRVLQQQQQQRSSSAAGFAIPAGLPRLHTLPEGSAKRSGSVMRPSSPKSPVASASEFESVEGSDEDDAVPENGKLENHYGHVNGNVELEGRAPFLAMSDSAMANGDQKTIVSASIIRSHSVSGDLHGVQPDPVAADILRKEPEQETFVRLKISPNGFGGPGAAEVPSVDEEEVYLLLQECLELRERYLFREEVAPWDKEEITDPSTPKPNPDPFAYSREKKTNHQLEIVDGVVRVYANKNSKDELFRVADATTFFTDLHRILRVIVLGNVRTVCHRRLELLQQVVFLLN